MQYQILTPILLPRGYIDWVHPWRVADGQPVYLYGEDFNAPYCPINIEVKLMKFSDMTCVFLLLVIWAQNFQMLQTVNTTMQRLPRVSCSRPAAQRNESK